MTMATEVSLFNILGHPETHFVEQAGLKLTKIHLPLPTKCWDFKTCDTTAWHLPYS